MNPVLVGVITVLIVAMPVGAGIGTLIGWLENRLRVPSPLIFFGLGPIIIVAASATMVHIMKAIVS